MPPPLRSPSIVSSLSNTTQICRAAQSRSFSATSSRDVRSPTRARRALFRWLHNEGNNFEKARPDSTNYLSAYDSRGQLKRVAEAAAERKEAEELQRKTAGDPSRPQNDNNTNPNDSFKTPLETARDLRVFPSNPSFISQPVLTEEFREKIWERIMLEGQSVREVSAELKVEMSRVGAVVRLKEIEKEWMRVGKSLVKPYAEAVMGMLPKTEYNSDPTKLRAHEPINDLPVHSATELQIFHPTSESRHFTRVDAAKVFGDDLLPADDRVPHPELALMHKDFKAGLSQEQIAENQQKRDDKDAKAKAYRAARHAAKLAAVQTVQTPRYEFRFTDVNVDDIGKDGRGHKGVGWRYGVPHMDRSRAQVKIPTRVA